MTIKRKGKFLIDTDLMGCLSIGIETDKLSACVKEVISKKAKGVFGAPCWGFKQDDLDFLASLKDLESIWFWDVNLKHVQAVYELKRLKKFGVNPKRPGIDFSRLQTLEEMVWDYNRKDSGIESLKKLKLFHIWHFNPKEKSFEGICVPNSVREMQILWANPKCLEGLSVMPHLKHLEIHRCRNLESLKELPRIAPKLEYLVVSACGKVSDGPEVVQGMKVLKHAFVHDTLLIANE